MVNNYLDGRDKRNIPSGQALAFATNNDPVMFEVFASGSNLEGEEALGYDLLVDNSEGGEAPFLKPSEEHEGVLAVPMWRGMLSLVCLGVFPVC